MAVPTSPLPVMRFAALLAGNEAELTAARYELTQWYGPIDSISESFALHAPEYHDEMGRPLIRQWVRFKLLFGPEQLARCKLETNMAETLLARQFAARGVQRPVNIDPGYIQRNKLVLATTKDAPHRLYMSEGVYGEAALRWTDHAWGHWPWTPEDYKTPVAGQFFTAARSAYLEQLQLLTAGH
jgi:hypothetical protein